MALTALFQVICQSAGLSEDSFDLPIQTKKKQNTSDVQKSGLELAMSYESKFFSFFMCELCVKPLKLPHSVG